MAERKKTAEELRAKTERVATHADAKGIYDELVGELKNPSLAEVLEERGGKLTLLAAMIDGLLGRLRIEEVTKGSGTSEYAKHLRQLKEQLGRLTQAVIEIRQLEDQARAVSGAEATAAEGDDGDGTLVVDADQVVEVIEDEAPKETENRLIVLSRQLHEVHGYGAAAAKAQQESRFEAWLDETLVDDDKFLSRLGIVKLPGVVTAADIVRAVLHFEQVLQAEYTQEFDRQVDEQVEATHRLFVEGGKTGGKKQEGRGKKGQAGGDGAEQQKSTVFSPDMAADPIARAVVSKLLARYRHPELELASSVTDRYGDFVLQIQAAVADRFKKASSADKSNDALWAEADVLAWVKEWREDAVMQEQVNQLRRAIELKQGKSLADFAPTDLTTTAARAIARIHEIYKHPRKVEGNDDLTTKNREAAKAARAELHKQVQELHRKLKASSVTPADPEFWQTAGVVEWVKAADHEDIVEEYTTTAKSRIRKNITLADFENFAVRTALKEVYRKLGAKNDAGVMLDQVGFDDFKQQMRLVYEAADQETKDNQFFWQQAGVADWVEEWKQGARREFESDATEAPLKFIEEIVGSCLRSEEGEPLLPLAQIEKVATLLRHTVGDDPARWRQVTEIFWQLHYPDTLRSAVLQVEEQTIEKVAEMIEQAVTLVKMQEESDALYVADGVENKRDKVSLVRFATANAEAILRRMHGSGDYTIHDIRKLRDNILRDLLSVEAKKTEEMNARENSTPDDRFETHTLKTYKDFLALAKTLKISYNKRGGKPVKRQFDVLQLPKKGPLTATTIGRDNANLLSDLIEGIIVSGTESMPGKAGKLRVVQRHIRIELAGSLSFVRAYYRQPLLADLEGLAVVNRVEERYRSKQEKKAKAKAASAAGDDGYHDEHAPAKSKENKKPQELGPQEINLLMREAIPRLSLAYRERLDQYAAKSVTPEEQKELHDRAVRAANAIWDEIPEKWHGLIDKEAWREAAIQAFYYVFLGVDANARGGIPLEYHPPKGTPTELTIKNWTDFMYEPMPRVFGRDPVRLRNQLRAYLLDEVTLLGTAANEAELERMINELTPKQLRALDGADVSALGMGGLAGLLQERLAVAREAHDLLEDLRHFTPAPQRPGAKIEQSSERIENMNVDKVIEKYLSYRDNMGSNPPPFDLDALKRGIPDCASYEHMVRYARALQDMIPSDRPRYTALHNAIKEHCLHAGQEIGDGVLSSVANSDSWAHWDLAKQHYLAQHSEESDAEDYVLADPLSLGENPDSLRVVQDISDRHLGWELYFARHIRGENVLDLLSAMHESYARIYELLDLPPKNNSQLLPSYQLTELGRLVRENKGIAGIDVSGVPERRRAIQPARSIWKKYVARAAAGIGVAAVGTLGAYEGGKRYAEWSVNRQNSADNAGTSTTSTTTKGRDDSSIELGGGLKAVVRSPDAGSTTEGNDSKEQYAMAYPDGEPFGWGWQNKKQFIDKNTPSPKDLEIQLGISTEGKVVNIMLRRTVTQAFDQLKGKFYQAFPLGTKSGVTELKATDGFRTFQRQQQMEKTRAKKVFVTKPGYSEHHLGTALDLYRGRDKNLYQWLFTPAPGEEFPPAIQHGFVPTEPSEPWHLRFVGVENAQDYYWSYKEKIRQAHEPLLSSSEPKK